MKVLPHVMRNINEFNIPAGNSNGYEVLYFGVNLMSDGEYKTVNTEYIYEFKRNKI